MSQWQPARAVDVVLRFNSDFGPALRASIEGVGAARMPPEQTAREACRVLARAVGVATHAYVWAAPQGRQVTVVKVPHTADDGGTVIALRLHLNTPMNSPIDYSNGQQIQGLLQALMGLPQGSFAGAELSFPPAEYDATDCPLLVTLNAQTLPGQKLCGYCRSPMPAYEVQCTNCGGRAEA